MTPPLSARSLPLFEKEVVRGLETTRARVLPFQAPATGLRLRRADVRDVPALHALLASFAADGLLLPRTPERIRSMVPDFVVAEAAGRLLGCAALRLYGTGRAEVCALAVAAEAHGRGLGRRLVETLLADARGLGLARVFALTLQTGFFTALGFDVAPVTDFPEKGAGDCAACPKRLRCPETCVAFDLEA